MSRTIDADPEFQALRRASAALGRDPARTQAAGGNTSLKRDGTMWIKASGTWLAHALDKDIMVPVHLAPMLDAFRRGDPAAETAVAFVDATQNPSGLRPSIETSVHAVIPQAVVVHIHCVETLALAVRPEVEALVAARLDGLRDVRWALVPYRKPGLTLAGAIVERLRPDTNVLVLANHGLVVAGDTVAEVEARLDAVCAALRAAPRPAAAPDRARLAALAEGTDYRVPEEAQAHGVALDEASLAHARAGSLYPDHVIFLGPGIVELPAARSVAAFVAEHGAPPMLVVPGAGVLLHRAVTNGADAMARCLADVTARVPPGVAVVAFTPAQDHELTNWEAEKYRQSLNARAG